MTAREHSLVILEKSSSPLRAAAFCKKGVYTIRGVRR
jgi:hypothetical protein